MKRNFRKLTALLSAFVMLLSLVGFMPAKEVKAEDTYKLFLAYGGGSNWEHQYYGDGASSNTETVKGTSADIAIGGTATIGVEIEAGSDKTWFAAPCLIIPGKAADAKIDYEIVSIKVDGKEVTPDLTAGDAYWTEGTGDYAAEDCVRLAGGCNEWATNYIAQPENFKTYEYTIKLNGIEFKAAGSSAPEALEGPFDMFLAYGGNEDWSLGYTGVDNDLIKGTTAQAKPGDTVTIGVNIEGGSNKTWYAAPCLIVPGHAEEAIVDFELISIKVDGKEVTADLSLGDKYWAETTGDFDKTDCVRLAGGCNEWGTNYITQPADFKTYEYTIKLNSVTIPGKEVQTMVSTDLYEVGLAIGGDVESGDWANSYVTGYNENITAETAFVRSGDTAHISLTFKNPVVYTWYLAPYMLNTNSEKDVKTISNIDFTINSIKFDGVEVTPDLTQGDAWWTEGTGDWDSDHCIRLAGGTNEWGAKYITCPAGYSKVEYDITFNTIEITEAVVAAFDEALLLGDYAGYLVFQCPDTWVFRDDWSNESNGLLGLNDGVNDYFTHVTWNDGATEEEKNLGGTITDAVIDGNGTYTVKIEGAEAGLHGSTKWNMLYVSTTIPYSCIELGGVTITDATIKVDGKKVGIDALITGADEVKTKNHPEVNGSYACIQFINTYNKKNPNALDSVPIPQESIEVTFTIAGLGKDSPTGGNVITTDAPEVIATPEPTPEPEKVEPTQAPEVVETQPTVTTAPTETPTVTSAPAEETDGGVNAGLIIGIIAAVVVIAAAVVFFLLKKKKND